MLKENDKSTTEHTFYFYIVLPPSNLTKSSRHYFYWQHHISQINIIITTINNISENIVASRGFLLILCFSS